MFMLNSLRSTCCLSKYFCSSWQPRTDMRTVTVFSSCWAEVTTNCEMILASRLLREQWIRAKYERNEFEFIEKQEPYSAGMFTIHGYCGSVTATENNLLKQWMVLCFGETGNQLLYCEKLHKFPVRRCYIFIIVDTFLYFNVLKKVLFKLLKKGKVQKQKEAKKKAKNNKNKSILASTQVSSSISVKR